MWEVAGRMSGPYRLTLTGQGLIFPSFRNLPCSLPNGQCQKEKVMSRFWVFVYIIDSITKIIKLVDYKKLSISIMTFRTTHIFIHLERFVEHLVCDCIECSLVFRSESTAAPPIEQSFISTSNIHQGFPGTWGSGRQKHEVPFRFGNWPNFTYLPCSGKTH